MKLYKGLLGLGLVLGLSTACTSDDKDGDTGDTDTDDMMTILECVLGESVTVDGTSYELFLNGLQILTANPNLAAGGFQNFTAETCDWTFGDNLLNVFQTGVTDINNGWDEEHVIPSTGFTDGDTDTPRLDHLELKIDHVDTIGELTGDDKTLFNSDDQGGLTYALRVYDAAGALADCIAWGHDVPGMFSGNVPDNNTDGHTDQSEISSANCATVGR